MFENSFTINFKGVIMRPKIGFKKIRGEGFKSMYQWDGMPPRKPIKGEFYISGSRGFEIAYEAKQDLATKYFIAVKSN